MFFFWKKVEQGGATLIQAKWIILDLVSLCGGKKERGQVYTYIANPVPVVLQDSLLHISTAHY